MGQGDPGIMDRQEFFLMIDPAVWKHTPFSNGLGNTDDGIIFPGHCQSRGRKEKKKKGFMFKVLSFFKINFCCHIVDFCNVLALAVQQS